MFFVLKLKTIGVDSQTTTQYALVRGNEESIVFASAGLALSSLCAEKEGIRFRYNGKEVALAAIEDASKDNLPPYEIPALNATLRLYTLQEALRLMGAGRLPFDSDFLRTLFDDASTLFPSKEELGNLLFAFYPKDQIPRLWHARRSDYFRDLVGQVQARHKRMPPAEAQVDFTNFYYVLIRAMQVENGDLVAADGLRTSATVSNLSALSAEQIYARKFVVDIALARRWPPFHEPPNLRACYGVVASCKEDVYCRTLFRQSAHLTNSSFDEELALARYQQALNDGDPTAKAIEELLS